MSESEDLCTEISEIAERMVARDRYRMNDIDFCDHTEADARLLVHKFALLIEMADDLEQAVSSMEKAGVPDWFARQVSIVARDYEMTA